MKLLPSLKNMRRMIFVMLSLGLAGPAVVSANESSFESVDKILSQERRLLMAMGTNRAKKVAGIGGRSIIRIASWSKPKAKLENLPSGKRPKLRVANLSIPGPTVSSFQELKSMPKATGGSEWACLTEALYFEARGESFSGISAVAEVIMNRKVSKKFPNSICGVISQGVGGKRGCQFSYKCDGKAEVYKELKAYARVAKMARLKLDGRLKKITDGALFYHTTAVRPSWSRKFHRTAKVGVHLFYRPS